MFKDHQAFNMPSFLKIEIIKKKQITIDRPKKERKLHVYIFQSLCIEYSVVSFESLCKPIAKWSYIATLHLQGTLMFVNLFEDLPLMEIKTTWQPQGWM